MTLSIRTRSIAPGAARCPPEICAPSNAGPVGRGGSEQPLPRAQHDLRVRADVHQQRDLVGEIGRFREDRAGRVRANVPGDARQDVDPRAFVAGQIQLARPNPHGRIRRERERRRSERHRVDAQEEVVHDRVAHDGEFENLLDIHAGPRREPGDQARHGAAHRLCHRGRATLMHHRV